MAVMMNPTETTEPYAVTTTVPERAYESPPPSYTERVTLTQAVRIKAVPTTCRVVRFRRFMAFRLAVAYGLESALPTLDRPTEEDKELFARLASDWFSLLYDEKIRKSARKIDKLETDIYAFIIFPADALLLPRVLAQHFMMIYHRHMSRRGGVLDSVSSSPGRIEPWTASTPASAKTSHAPAELVLHRSIFIDKAILSPEFNELLRDVNRNLCDNMIAPGFGDPNRFRIVLARQDYIDAVQEDVSGILGMTGMAAHEHWPVCQPLFYANGDPLPEKRQPDDGFLTTPLYHEKDAAKFAVDGSSQPLQKPMTPGQSGLGVMELLRELRYAVLGV